MMSDQIYNLLGASLRLYLKMFRLKKNNSNEGVHFTLNFNRHMMSILLMVSILTPILRVHKILPHIYNYSHNFYLHLLYFVNKTNEYFWLMLLLSIIRT